MPTVSRKSYKRNFRMIAIAVSVALAAMMCVQTVWMVKLYRGMDDQFRSKVRTAIDKAAYDELYARSEEADNNASSVSASISKNKIKLTTTYKDSMNLGELDPSKIEAIEIQKGNASLGKNEPARLYLFQTNIRKKGFSINKFDTLVGANLKNAGIDLPYYLELVEPAEKNPHTMVASDTSKQLSISCTDTLIRHGSSAVNGFSSGDSAAANSNDSPMMGVSSVTVTVKRKGRVERYIGDFKSLRKTEAVDSAKVASVRNPISFDLPLDSESLHICRLYIENPNRMFLYDMRWIIISSAGIFVLLCLSFIYLMRTLFREKSLEEMRSDFTHNITHELKTPIAVAYAADDAMLNFDADKDTAKRTEYLTVIHDQLGLLSQMVERILNITVQESGEFTIKPADFPMKKAIDELCATLPLKYKKRIHFDVVVSPKDLTVKVDEFHFRNVLSNLLDNAVKYSGDKVNVKVRAWRQTAAREPAGIIGSGCPTKITVEDDGIGIPASERDRIFEKYYRIPTGDVQNAKGFGLGLYYSKLVVEKHGGTIAVGTGESGKGAKFTITLPDSYGS